MDQSAPGVTERAVIITTASGKRHLRMLPPEFVEVLEWIIDESGYQVEKFGYGDDDLVHAREGLAEDSWFWQKGVLNYAGRVRLFGLVGDARLLGAQALLKLITTLISQVEHLRRGGDLERLPKAGVSSGEIA